MTPVVVRAALALSLLTACSSEFVVLRQRAPDVGEEPAPDAGIDGGSLLDADLGTESPDSGVAPDATALPPDGELHANVVSGFAHTCAIVNGTLFCWGADEVGQAGAPGEADRTRPAKLSDDVFIDVCAGERHSCALRADGTTLCWGANGFGELGVGDRTPRVTPTALDARRFAALSCGGANTCALEPTGELWCWGDNSEGKLGQDDPPLGETGSLALSATPVPVLTQLRFRKVSVGQGHVCALSAQGRAYCWGRNNLSQLGVDSTFEQTRTPLPVLGGSAFIAIAAGQFHSCAVDVRHALWCWGQTANGRLGLQTDQTVLPEPTRLEGGDFATVSASWLHSCALKRDGTLFCWGRGEEGQLGGGDASERDQPTQVGRDGRWRSISAGQFHSCAFAEDGLYCWGANDTGQLGLADNARRRVPVKVSF